MRVMALIMFCMPLVVSGCGGGGAPTSESKPQEKQSLAQQPTSEQNTLLEPTPRIAALILKLRDNDRQVAFDAATELGNMGEDAASAIPSLVNLATFNEQGAYSVHPTLAAAKALQKISAERSVPYLVEALEEPQRRYWAAHILGEFHDVARSAIPALVSALRTTVSAQTDDERAAAAQAAAALDQIRPEGLSALIGEMGHESAEVRKLAVRATPRGGDGYPAVSALTERLTDPNDEVRSLAAIALGDIGPAAKDALPHLRFAIEREQLGRVRVYMQQALTSIQGTRAP